LGSGTLIGELSFLQGVRRTATIIAADETLCLQIREDKFQSWLEEHPQQSISFYRHLSSAIAERLRSNIQREETLLLFGQESPILRQTEKEILSLANRLRDSHMMAEAKKTGIEVQMRDQLKHLQAEQEEGDAEGAEIFWVTENTEETLFSKNLQQLSDIYQEFYEQALDIFDALKCQLNRFRVEDMCFDIACRAREYFIPILEKTSIYRELSNANGTESPNLMSEILLKRSIDSNEMALSAAICAQETVQAYRTQLHWFQEKIREQSYSDITSLTLINDITGVFFALLYPLCAPYPIVINFYVDNPYSFGCIDVNFQQYGRSQYVRKRIQDWSRDVIDGNILQKEQDLVFLPTVLDYLSAPHALRLLDSIHKILKDEGTLFFSVLMDTHDTAFFCDFLGWSTIRRSKGEVEGLLKSVGYTNIKIQVASGALLVSAKKN
jgi:CRP-like cAMP-binding protein